MNSSMNMISPMSLGFPVDVETPERRRYRKEQEERKKRFTADDLASYRPSATGIHSHIIWPHATMKGYLTKHLPPVFSFTKNRKRRYVILADRFLYCFKTDSPTNKFREFIELGPDTQAFVSDHISNVNFCIEIRKPGSDGATWFLQADDADGMKIWLERIKKTIHYMADENNKNDKGPINKEKLHFVHSAEEVYHPFNSDSNSVHDTNSSCGSISISANTTPRSSQHDIDANWRLSDSTNWTDRHSSTCSSNYASSPPMSPTMTIAGSSLCSSSVSTPTPFGHHPQLHHTPSIMQRNDSMRSSMSNDDYIHSNRINSIRSVKSPGLPDVLPPQLPPPTSKLPPPPSSYL
ncbi:hypothetical protein BCR42DRAFT_427024 [Absidia repens]|uniref:PH domain-containing protein n=1 Tax=Absidia repens TaxID=90262 RepID=A0A1X2I0G3_9FUNG|nr:hypothetical protein BCR42DRAFT_427024 [Absidia repens]